MSCFCILSSGSIIRRYNNLPCVIRVVRHVVKMLCFRLACSNHVTVLAIQDLGNPFTATSCLQDPPYFQHSGWLSIFFRPIRHRASLKVRRKSFPAVCDMTSLLCQWGVARSVKNDQLWNFLVTEVDCSWPLQANFSSKMLIFWLRKYNYEPISTLLLTPTCTASSELIGCHNGVAS